MNTNHIVSSYVTTRHGETLWPNNSAAYVAARHKQSERQRMLAAVARIETRLAIERARDQKHTSVSVTPPPFVEIFDARKEHQIDLIFASVIAGLGAIAAVAALMVVL